MNYLILGIVIFFGMHLVPSLGRVRQILVARLGETRYLAIYAIISMLGFILIIYGKSQVTFQPIWQPPIWGAKVAPIIMVFSIILLASANMKTNIKRFTRHPMLWGVTIWSIAHLLANGDLGSLLLFGSFGVFALIDMFSANLRGASKQMTRYPMSKDVVVIVAGLLTYGVFLFLHPYLFGVAVIN